MPSFVLTINQANALAKVLNKSQEPAIDPFKQQLKKRLQTYKAKRSKKEKQLFYPGEKVLPYKYTHFLRNQPSIVIGASKNIHREWVYELVSIDRGLIHSCQARCLKKLGELSPEELDKALYRVQKGQDHARPLEAEALKTIKKQKFANVNVIN